jgi:hypothetical protein
MQLIGDSAKRVNRQSCQGTNEDQNVSGWNKFIKTEVTDQKTKKENMRPSSIKKSATGQKKEKRQARLASRYLGRGLT